MMHAYLMSMRLGNAQNKPSMESFRNNINLQYLYERMQTVAVVRERVENVHQSVPD